MEELVRISDPHAVILIGTSAHSWPANTDRGLLEVTCDPVRSSKLSSWKVYCLSSTTVYDCPFPIMVRGSFKFWRSSGILTYSVGDIVIDVLSSVPTRSIIEGKLTPVLFVHNMEGIM